MDQASGRLGWEAHLKVSVLFTVKNGSAWIDQCLDTVRSQTTKAAQVVIVDDGSIDETLSKVEQYIQRHPDFPVELIKTAGVGRAKALNIAWRSCSSEILANIDVDDSWHERKLEMQTSILLERNADFVTTSAEITNVDGVSLPSREMRGDWRLWRDEDFFVTNPIIHSSFLARKSVFEQCSGYSEGLSRHIDYDMWIRVLSVGLVGVNLNDRLTIKRLHAGQSFEARQRMSYIWTSFLMKCHAIRALNAPSQYYLLATATSMFSLLPRPLRRLLKS